MADRPMVGTYGRVWVNNVKMAMVVSFETKVTGEYEDMDIAEELGKIRSFVGYSGEGTLKVKKLDNDLAQTIARAFLSGLSPDVVIVGELKDPGNTVPIRVEFSGVTFDEATLLAFEAKKTIEEEFPFKFSKYQYL